MGVFDAEGLFDAEASNINGIVDGPYPFLGITRARRWISFRRPFVQEHSEGLALMFAPGYGHVDVSFLGCQTQSLRLDE